MDITRAQQIALDDTLVAHANRLTIGKSNLLLSSDLKSKELTLQVVYDVFKLTPFYKAFEITADVLEIYMQEFWTTAIVHHHSTRFKMKNKKHIVNLEYFREMLQICPKIPEQQFKEPTFEEEILTFLRDLGHSGEIEVITDVNVNKLHQPWRSFAVEDFIYQVETKNAKKGNEMYYPRFTKVIGNFFMTKDQSIPRRNRLYGAILPDELTNEAIKDFESYKEYYAIASGGEPPKTKARVKKKQAGSYIIIKTKTPPTAQGKRLKTSAKEAKPAKKKQPTKTSKAKCITVLSERPGADEGTDGKLGVLDVPTYGFDDEQISWKSRDEENDDEVGMSDDDDNNDDDDDDVDNQDDDGQDDNGPEYDGQDDEEERKDEEDNEEEGSDLRVQTPSHYESTDDEESDKVTQGGNVEGEELNEEINEEEEVNEMYRDVNVNLEGRDTKMTDVQQTNVHGFILKMLNPNPNTGIDSILNLNTESTSLVDVPVSRTVEMPPSFAITIPLPLISLIQPLQKTPVSTLTIVPSTYLQNLPTFDFVFKFKDRVKALEDDFSEFKQTNQFAAAVSLIPVIVDTYLANKMNEAIKTAVQLQSDRLRDEAQAENAYFINKLDDNIKKIIKEQVKAQVKEQVTKILPRIEKTINEQLEAEILTRSSNDANTSHAVATNLSELELKKILINKIESNKSIHRFDHQKTLYKALVDAYKSDKLILNTYGDTVTVKRCRDDQDEDEEPSAG
ncbi:hypothetical protein Tco_0289488, partial [Tanacetum coccineum]